jgi:hypothetical protein
MFIQELFQGSHDCNLFNIVVNSVDVDAVEDGIHLFGERGVMWKTRANQQEPKSTEKITRRHCLKSKHNGHGGIWTERLRMLSSIPRKPANLCTCVTNADAMSLARSSMKLPSVSM